MSWLAEYRRSAGCTDQFSSSRDHQALLALGLFGEAGSIVSELKKEAREREAYPRNRRVLEEELGDFLWYFVRLGDLVAPEFISIMADDPDAIHSSASTTPPFLEFGAAVGELLTGIQNAPQQATLPASLQRIWHLLTRISAEVQIPLREAAQANIQKRDSRWPLERKYAPLFDEGFPEEDRLPRQLEISFRSREHGGRSFVMLKCNGLNFGDRLSDNIRKPDGYGYHDIFHFANAVHLGWSPVVRALLRCKRKSRPEIDEAEDGARAGIIEEGVSAIVFSRAKELGFYDGLTCVDYDLLKTIRDFVTGYEVERVPLWQWEAAILDGFRIFRQLRIYSGGRVILDLNRRELRYIASR